MTRSAGFHAASPADHATEIEHAAIWRNFVERQQIRLPSEQAPIPAAVSGIVTFAVPISDSAIRASLARVTRQLDETGSISPFPEDYWHATVVPPTLITQDVPHPPYLMGEQFIAHALNAARQAVQGCVPFLVTVRGLNAFPDVVVAIPYEGGNFGELHRRLRVAIPELPERYLDGHDPLPHISLAQYKSRDGLDSLASILEGLREQLLGSFEVHGIEMVVLPVDDGVIGEGEKFAIPFHPNGG